MLRRSLRKLTAALNAAGTLWVLVLATLICADILGRAGFNSPILGVPEIVQFSIAGIVYLQLGDAVRSGRLIRSDAFIGRLHLHHPVVLQWLLAAIDLISTALFALIAVSMAPETLEAWQRNFAIGSRGYFSLPAWPIKAMIVIGAGLVAIHLALQAAWHVRAALGGAALPGNPAAPPEL